MTFSYSGNPSSSSLDLVRFLLQDTDSTDVLLSNEEINYLIATWTNPYEVARVGAETISGQFTRLADSTSMSMSGKLERSVLRKRSKGKSCSIGSTPLMPSK